MHRDFRFYAPFLSLLLCACSSTPVSQTAPSGTSALAAAAPTTATGPSGAAGSVQASTARPTHLEPDSALSREHSIYFDFDGFIVHREYATMLERHAEYLRDHQALSVKVQGNTDERGGREYNLALGQRRAEAVKASLGLYGVKDSQVEAVSLGKEKPVAQGHDESSWQQNRRADIVYSK